ncbi:hypothetical protein BH18ACI4_BH18ACI4_14870 [soil metagenome]
MASQIESGASNSNINRTKNTLWGRLFHRAQDLASYEVSSQIGAGGMGEVYLAHDTQLDRTVALKILLENFAADQTRLRRFIQEAKAASGLNHPNIVTVYEREPLVRVISCVFVDPLILPEFFSAACWGLRVAGWQQSIRLPMVERFSLLAWTSLPTT